MLGYLTRELRCAYEPRLCRLQALEARQCLADGVYRAVGSFWVTGRLTGDAARSLIDTEKKVEWLRYSGRDDWSVGPRIAIDSYRC